MKKIILLFLFISLLTRPVMAQTGQRGVGTTGTNMDTIKRNLALVVGISSYPNINRLLYADDDAYLFADYLINQKICEKKDVMILVDSVATKANFFKELRKLLDRTGQNDRVFIYFAGHGDVENDIESGFLLTYNCEPNNYPATDAIDISMLEKFVGAFTKKNTKVVLITDACRSGNLAGGTTGANITMGSLTNGFQNTIKILSCQPNQLSQEKQYPGGGHGIFTYHLIDGLNGLADKDNDQFISLRELDRYLDEVSDETGQQQVPKTEGDPQARIASFDPQIKLALIAKKENKDFGVATRNRGSADSSWFSNEYFKKFTSYTRKNQLTSPAKENAYELILLAQKNSQPKAMIDDMKLELGAILEDEAQHFINTYLRGALTIDQALLRQQLINAIDYINKLELLIGEKDIRYNEIHVKKLFLDAYYVFKTTDKKQYKQALSWLETANTILRNQAWITNAMGLFYEELSQPREAEQSYQQASRLAPQWSYPWNNLGMFYWNKGKYPDAERAYLKALDLDSTYGFAWNGLGNVYDDMQRYEEAINAYRQSTRFNPLDDDPWNGMGNVYSDMGKTGDALSAYKRAIELDPADANPQNGLGNVFVAMEKNTEAEEAYRASIRKDSTYPFPYNNLGIMMENRGNRKEAEKFYRSALRYDSLYADAWRNLGDVLEASEKYGEAIAAYKKASAIAPANGDYWNGLGLAYRSMYDYENATQVFLTGISHDSANYHLWFNLGIMYKNAEQYKNGAIAFQKTVEIEPTIRSHWEYLLDMLDRSGQKEEKEKWKEKMKSRFPD